MFRILFAVCIALLGTGVSWARKTVVWDSPAIEYGTHNGDGYFNLALDVTRVELKDSETVVNLTLRLRPDGNRRFWFAPDTRLEAGGKSYAVQSVEGLTLGQPIQTDVNSELKAVFRFQPVPRETGSVDLVEGQGKDGFRIEGIRPAEACRDKLVPSYWRNEETGAWEIAFLEDCAVYDCKIWEYRKHDIDSKTGTARIVMQCGGVEMTVTVGKDRKGRREMRIGQDRLVCSMLTGRFLPDYPVTDTRTDFAGSGLRAGVVTISGWLMNMPEHYRQDRTFSFMQTDVISGEGTSVSADLDEQGRFAVRMPVSGPTEFTCDWGRCFVRTMLEPGQTYFMLYDFKEGRRYFMGRDARLQNELFRFPLDWNQVRMERDGGDFDRYIASVDSLLTARYAYIDSLCAAHPSLSARFRAYRKGHTLWQQARDFGQARFQCENFNLPENAFRYARETFFDHLPEQLTLHRDIDRFLVDFLSDAAGRGPVKTFAWNLRDHIAECASNDGELALLQRWAAFSDEVATRVATAPTLEEKVRLSEKINADSAALLRKVEALVNSDRVSRLADAANTLELMHDCVQLLDSLQAAPSFKSVRLCRLVHDRINGNCRSLPQTVLDTLRTMAADCRLGLERVEQRNAYFQALERREFDQLVLKPSDDLQGIAEGKALLQKILEPFKGRPVLLDVWGTWCGPCKEALKYSTEEYARLSRYGIAYVYLANNSPRESWENIIKMYNVSGENVAHYNLPREQQQAIERYLGVNSFPTYKLFDRAGNLLDLKVDARHLDELESLLRQL